MDEMAEFDDEALLTYITNATGKPKLTWYDFFRKKNSRIWNNGWAITGLDTVGALSKCFMVCPGFLIMQTIWICLSHSLLLLGWETFGRKCWFSLLRWAEEKKIKEDFSPCFHSLFCQIDSGNIFSTIGYNDFLSSLYDTEDVCIFCKACCDDLISSIVGPGSDNATLFNASKTVCSLFVVFFSFWRLSRSNNKFIFIISLLERRLKRWTPHKKKRKRKNSDKKKRWRTMRSLSTPIRFRCTILDLRLATWSTTTGRLRRTTIWRKFQQASLSVCSPEDKIIWLILLTCCGSFQPWENLGLCFRKTLIVRQEKNGKKMWEADV